MVILSKVMKASRLWLYGCLLFFILFVVSCTPEVRSEKDIDRKGFRPLYEQASAEKAKKILSRIYGEHCQCEKSPALADTIVLATVQETMPSPGFMSSVIAVYQGVIYRLDEVMLESPDLANAKQIYVDFIVVETNCLLERAEAHLSKKLFSPGTPHILFLNKTNHPAVDYQREIPKNFFNALESCGAIPASEENKEAVKELLSLIRHRN